MCERDRGRRIQNPTNAAIAIHQSTNFSSLSSVYGELVYGRSRLTRHITRTEPSHLAPMRITSAAIYLMVKVVPIAMSKAWSDDSKKHTVLFARRCGKLCRYSPGQRRVLASRHREASLQTCIYQSYYLLNQNRVDVACGRDDPLTGPRATSPKIPVR